MGIDAGKLLGMPPIITRHCLERRDTILYALGVGASELSFVFEEQLSALPTMAVVLAYPGFIWQKPDLGADWKRILHVGQRLTLHGRLPVEGQVRGETSIQSILDKGPETGAIVEVLRKIFDEGNRLIATVVMESLLRGDGGCGGNTDRASNSAHEVPENISPNWVVESATLPLQAMLYRLSGDWNPVHVDPQVAKQAGLERPVLHGLCTYGFVGRALLDKLARGDTESLKVMNCRFTSPVYPGDSIRTEIWREASGRGAFRAWVPERGVKVIDNGFVEYE